MSKSTINTNTKLHSKMRFRQADHINQRFEHFQSLCIKFRSYLNSTLDLTRLLHEGQIDQSTTIIEHNTKFQSLILDEILNWCLTPNELDPRVSSELLDVDYINQRFKQFQFLCVQFRLSLNSILCWTHLLHQGRLNQSDTIKAFKFIEDNAKLQNSLLNKLLD